MTETSGASRILLRPMILTDVDQVAAIDRAAFPTPWPKDAFLYELRHRNSVCWVAEHISSEGEPTLLGSIVIWLVDDKGHVATLAVKQGYRRRHIAQYLLARGLLESKKFGAQKATLEVRASNEAAQHLYSKFGFNTVGLQENYYKDTHEDAVKMMLMPLEKEALAELALHG